MEDKIIIIGGGTDGLAMSLFLNRAGIKSEIYEKASEFKDVGASYGCTATVSMSCRRLDWINS